jgi:hypothetical protein
MGKQGLELWQDENERRGRMVDKFVLISGGDDAGWCSRSAPCAPRRNGVGLRRDGCLSCSRGQAGKGGLYAEHKLRGCRCGQKESPVAGGTHVAGALHQILGEVLRVWGASASEGGDKCSAMTDFLTMRNVGQDPGANAALSCQCGNDTAAPQMHRVVKSQGIGSGEAGVRPFCAAHAANSNFRRVRGKYGNFSVASSPW